MRKSRFITGTMSLTLALAVGVTSFAQLSGQVRNDEFVCEYETTTSVEIVEKSANEVNVLMAKKQTIPGNISLEFETSAPISTEATNAFKQTKEATQKTVKNSKAKKVTNKKKNKKSKNGKLKNMGTYKITAYCSCSSCCGKSDGITASGTKAKEGRTIAADTSVLPFGTKVVIDGRTYTVEDRGGAINGKRIDVYFSSHKEALKWGVKYLKVYTKK